MRVPVFPPFLSLIFLSMEKGTGDHPFHMTRETRFHDLVLFLFRCLGNAAGLRERGGPFCLWGEELCTMAPKSLQRRVIIAWSRKGDLLVNGDSRLHNE